MDNWLIDGMNLIGTRPDRWWRDRGRAMRDLVEELERFAARTGDGVTVVFDARPQGSVRGRGVEVRFASRPGRDAADQEIARIVTENPATAGLTVVSSDRRLAAAVRAGGARVVSSGAFRRRLDEQS